MDELERRRKKVAAGVEAGRDVRTEPAKDHERLITRKREAAEAAAAAPVERKTIGEQLKEARGEIASLKIELAERRTDIEAICNAQQKAAQNTAHAMRQLYEQIDRERETLLMIRVPGLRDLRAWRRWWLGR